MGDIEKYPDAEYDVIAIRFHDTNTQSMFRQWITTIGVERFNQWLQNRNYVIGLKLEEKPYGEYSFYGESEYL